MGALRAFFISVLFICIVLQCTGTSSAATYSGGSGTVNDPYLLSTDNDIDTLSATSADWSMNFTLTQNIILVGDHTPIGNSSPFFTGDFDGNGYAIKNLSVYKATNYTGFFSYAAPGANIHELRVETSSNGVVSTMDFAGILVGYAHYSTISNCSATGNVTGNDSVGGLAGSIDFGSNVSNCFSTGNVTGNDSVGGLTGSIDFGGSVSNCFATGNVTGNDSVGGLAGYYAGSVSNSFATVFAIGSSSVGGLVGSVGFGGSVSNSYYSGIPVSGGGISTSYDNFMSFSFVSGASGLDWNASGTQDVITTADDTSFIWRIVDGYTLPYFQYQDIPYSGGSGTVNDPYLLSSDSDIDELSASSDDWDKYFLLTQDITLDGNHTPIGNSSIKFTGDFDGNGYAVTDLTVYETSNYVGLFGYTNTGANIHDLEVETSSYGVVSTGSYVGILVGYNVDTVSNCSATGNVTGVSQIGGLVGESGASGTISNSFATGNVSGSFNYAGGLVGYNRGTVSNCSATSIVTGSSEVGGLIGESNSIVRNCYATGDVIASGYYVGGLLGINWNEISNCYATGDVSSSGNYVGGLVGLNFVNVSKSFATGTVTGTITGGLIGANDGSAFKCYYSGSPSDSTANYTAYDNLTNFAFISGSPGLYWNESSDVITKEVNSSFIWKIDDGSTLPYFQYQVIFPPVANFTSNVTEGAIPLSVNFTDTSTNIPTSWLWDFGDGNTSTEQGPTHIYVSPGTYNVSLNATNFAGSDTNTRLSYITVAVTPVADFTADVTSGTAPLSVSFMDLSTNTPISWFWDFGDGSTSTLQDPAHSYTTAGSYNVTLNATNAAGSNVSIRTAYINVSPVSTSTSSSSSSSGTRVYVSQGQDPGIVMISSSLVKRITSGSEVNYDFSDSGTLILGLNFEAKDNKGLVVARVQVLSIEPDGVPYPSGKSYQVMSIDVGSEGTISSDNAANIQISFKVSKQWIEENNIDISTIRMARYHGEQWNDLPTYQESEDNGYVYFYTETSGFSIFSVVGDEVTDTSGQASGSSTVVEEEAGYVGEEGAPDTPGFTALAGVLVLSLAFLVSRKMGSE